MRFALPCLAVGLVVGGLGACQTTEIAGCPDGTVLSNGSCVLDPDALSCGAGTVAKDGQCVPDSDVQCTPDCEGRACGPDGCGGWCGACEGDKVCNVAGQCEDDETCLPICVVEETGQIKECGDDTCGGSCGSCDDPARSVCDTETFTCVAACIPDCAHRACGDDGCGGSCGSCGDGLSCSEAGLCVPDGWTCAPAAYNGRDQCDCGCGAADPDCTLSALALVGCDPDSRCVAGVCEPRIPTAWTCPDLAYDDGILCDCGCGAADPDCNGALPVNGCSEGETCDATSACVACVPSCTGKTCGNDGCGGSCGACDAGLACVDGACIEGCSPTPLLCQTHTCGDDGCGGSCGTCPDNTLCYAGNCQVNPGYSCYGHCNASAPAGCGCDAACVGQGDCCPDYVAACVCVPDCDGKSCGPDGCGGSCGACPGGTPYCDGDGLCQTVCTPQCAVGECGDDGCGGQCGSCGDGEECNVHRQCAPAAWTCPAFFYGDGTVCDCGCGAIDPDCDTIGLTDGCPLGAACDDASGYCELSFCGADSQCAPPTWCVGDYLAGDGRRRGVCEAPLATGKPSGASCGSDYACASGLCQGGLCRSHCGSNSDCAIGETCIGFEVVEGLTQKSLGVVTVCDRATAIGAACTKQSDCAGDTTCLAFIDPANLGVMYRCGLLPNAEGDEGIACEGNFSCPTGLVCAEGQCMRACPGGAGDCPPGSSCGDAMLQGGPTALESDDVQAKICVPE